jgi:hypothetical protein
VLLSCLINFEATQQDVSIVKNFQGLFPKDLPRLPLDHEIKFCIELGLSTVVVFKAPYKMALFKLGKIKSQFAGVVG